MAVRVATTVLVPIAFIMYWVRPIGKSIPDLPHTPAKAELYDAVMMVISQKLGRKCTVPAGS